MIPIDRLTGIKGKGNDNVEMVSTRVLHVFFPKLVGSSHVSPTSTANPCFDNARSNRAFGIVGSSFPHLRQKMIPIDHEDTMNVKQAAKQLRSVVGFDYYNLTYKVVEGKVFAISCEIDDTGREYIFSKRLSFGEIRKLLSLMKREK